MTHISGEAIKKRNRYNLRNQFELYVAETPLSGDTMQMIDERTAWMPDNIKGSWIHAGMGITPDGKLETAKFQFDKHEDALLFQQKFGGTISSFDQNGAA